MDINIEGKILIAQREARKTMNNFRENIIILLFILTDIPYFSVCSLGTIYLNRLIKSNWLWPEPEQWYSVKASLFANELSWTLVQAIYICPKKEVDEETLYDTELCSDAGQSNNYQDLGAQELALSSTFFGVSVLDQAY